jgi:hypothetical protein
MKLEGAGLRVLGLMGLSTRVMGSQDRFWRKGVAQSNDISGGGNPELPPLEGSQVGETGGEKAVLKVP